MDEVVATKPTLGANVEEIQYKNMRFLMWVSSPPTLHPLLLRRPVLTSLKDIGGQESARATWSSYYSGTSVIIFVIDSTDRTRLPISKKELTTMLNHEVLKKDY
ncbi:ADP-ribosylation factor-like protein [Patescibacteria group bacterium]|nr:ADP-ribosylation factor-like protein [Patescibacteria group bacterium]